MSVKDDHLDISALQSRLAYSMHQHGAAFVAYGSQCKQIRADSALYSTHHDATMFCSNIAVHAAITAKVVAGLCCLTIHI